MSIVVKDAAGADQYFGTTGLGTAPSPYLSIPADFYMEVAKGNVPGHSIVNKFGRNGVVGTTLTHISISGQYQTPQTAQSLEILSSNVNNHNSCLQWWLRSIFRKPPAGRDVPAYY